FALQNGVDIPLCLSFVTTARSKGLSVPVVLMGYYNPFLMYDNESATSTSKLMKDCSEAGVNGFIVVDLPPGEAKRFRDSCAEFGLSYIPLIAPSTTPARIASLVKVADSFIYVVSRMGVTGAQQSVNSDLPSLVGRIRAHTNLPLAVGFGVSSREHFEMVGKDADGVVIGSKIVTTLKGAAKPERAQKVKDFALMVTGRTTDVPLAAAASASAPAKPSAPNGAAQDDGKVHHLQSHVLEDRFGQFGGQYAPEALVDCLDEIEQAFVKAKDDPTFWEEFRSHYPYIGRPSPLHLARRLTEECDGARIWLKREDLNHTGSHKINNALGQVLLARRLGKSRIIAETGAGPHGV
ncbi:tryptophan synthetase, partial [Quaeritorhiza haematococci]